MTPPNDGRFLGFDLGAECIRVAEVRVAAGVASAGPSRRVAHQGDVVRAMAGLLPALDWARVDGAAATGRMAAALRLPRIPRKAAVAEGATLLHPDHPDMTVVSIGAQGFAVVELRADGTRHVRENGRCSQGTGSFLRQLVGRFDLDLPQADLLVANVVDPAHLSGRCPVILKTDMTHLANRGQDRAQILAGLYDAVCDNVRTLIRPRSGGAAMLLAGGVARSSRVRARFAGFARDLGMTFLDGDPERDAFLEAFGAATAASRAPRMGLPAAATLVAPSDPVDFETLPPLAVAMQRVRRLSATRAPWGDARRRVVLGLDIGSTGSKAVAVDADGGGPLWDTWARTLGDPVAAARGLVADFLAAHGDAADVVAVGVTGSGRQIVGSLAASALGAARIFVLNEIAAHAAGAVHWDPDVDTIFELGGQDAKYIRLEGGRVVDAAMNEACSAGTGSFIEEQGRCFEGVGHVGEMGRLALAADHAVSLGQHCSVFMAEVVEQAIAGGRPREAVLAGLYDSVVGNYLNRVKGARPVGNRVFCQGMPFASDALAAAVARRTGGVVVVPPDPGTIGALGIALLARDQVPAGDAPLPLDALLAARVVTRDTFTCRSTRGCGAPGNACRIDRLVTEVGGRRGTFTWGGHCALYDRAGGRGKLPDGAPDPFREREALARRLCAAAEADDGQPVRGTVALTDEFALKSLAPFFATFLRALGFAPRVFSGADRADLQRGIEAGEIPWCAPMQVYQGVAERMAAADVDAILAPMVRELPRDPGERLSATCPIVQAAPRLLRQSIGRRSGAPRLLDPVVQVGPEGLRSRDFQDGCRALARDLGVPAAWRQAWERATACQEAFDAGCREIGARALAWARERGLPVVVVLGRSYTVYNDILNSNVPGLLRELGALALPVDCFPLPPGTPAFGDVYWRHAQANLRAAHAIRRDDDLYPVYCSNYSCGPDSFVLHFFGWQMAHKPWAVLETDGHAGDAGTRTRLEAFLFCVDQDRAAGAQARAARPVHDFRAIDGGNQDMATTRARDDLLLIPPMGVASYVTSAALRGEGFRCETLPLPDREALALGRRHTSGKECVPMTITLGSVLQRLAPDRDTGEHFAFLMPTADGPCRFGVYNLLHKIVFQRTGWGDRVRIVAPSDADYFAGLSPDFQLRLWSGMVAGDVLLAALHDVRPVETRPGAAQAVFDRAFARLVAHMEHPRPASLGRALLDVPRDMGGVRDIVRDAAAEFAAVRDFDRDVPTVAMVGEIYVRLDPFANDFLADRLERCGLRVRLAPFVEWIEYTAWTQRKRLVEGRPLPGDAAVPAFLTGALQEDVLERLWAEMAGPLRWRPRTTVGAALAAGGRYVSQDLLGEAILTVGTPLAEFEAGEVDGVVSVAPLECMPAKIAEAHFLRVDRDTGLPSLSLPVIGDPVDPRVIEDFAFEVREAAARRRERGRGAALPSLGTLGWTLSRRVLGTALDAAALIPLGPFANGRDGGPDGGNGRRDGRGIHLTPSPFPVTSRAACERCDGAEDSWPGPSGATRSCPWP